eukprot:scaffold584_cov132-Cylindrotheca_fusiformis.AAC.14
METTNSARQQWRCPWLIRSEVNGSYANDIVEGHLAERNWANVVTHPLEQNQEQYLETGRPKVAVNSSRTCRLKNHSPPHRSGFLLDFESQQ